MPPIQTRTKSYRGTSRSTIQEALERAIAKAARTAKPDQMVRWTLTSVSGTSGGIAGRTEYMVKIDASLG